jgi:hypothetical protein
MRGFASATASSEVRGDPVRRGDRPLQRPVDVAASVDVRAGVILPVDRSPEELGLVPTGIAGHGIVGEERAPTRVASFVTNTE